MLKWRLLVKFVVLLAFWFVLSGTVDWQHALAGSAAAVLVLLFWRHKEQDTAGLRLYGLFYGLGLGLVMLMDVCRAAWHVAIIILCRRPIMPEFVCIETPLQSRLARVVLANCITLTPGTLTVSLEGSTLLVHALTPEHAQSLANWRVHKLLKIMEAR